MTALETAKAVLAKASLFDQTFARPDLGIAVAWAEALGDIDQGDALRVVTEHYAAQTRRLMPADVITGVHRTRSERLGRDFEDIPELDAVAHDPIAYKATLREHRRRIGDPDRRGTVTTTLPRQPVAELLDKSTFGRMPSTDPSAAGAVVDLSVSTAEGLTG